MEAPEEATATLPDDRELAAIEEAAVLLARLAGAEITNALERGVAVEYKSEGKGAAAPTDPVSEVDREVEDLLRHRVGREFPGHAIIGEEIEEHVPGEEDFVWVVDPLDGTTNFVNGFPLFTSAIGVLYRGIPVVGATWCSTSGVLRPGVYHARAGSNLFFDGMAVPPEDRNPGLRRRLSAAPGGAPGRTAQWDNRVTGSAALECAMVAAGIFTSARFGGLHIWDVAGGIVLTQAAERQVWEQPERGEWRPFMRFDPPSQVRDGRAPTIRDWSRPLLLGTGEAIETLLPKRQSVWQRAKQLVLPGTGNTPG
jgi:myo-inositol-1(or 4)-monophosphatase